MKRAQRNGERKTEPRRVEKGKKGKPSEVRERRQENSAVAMSHCQTNRQLRRKKDKELARWRQEDDRRQTRLAKQSTKIPNGRLKTERKEKR